MYYGQRVLILDEGEDYPYRCSGGLIDLDGYLLLSSIESLSDEDQITLFRNSYPMFVDSAEWNGKGMPTVKRLNSQIHTNGSYSYKTHATLISLGCAVKFYDSLTHQTITLSDLTESGIIKIKE